MLFELKSYIRSFVGFLLTQKILDDSPVYRDIVIHVYLPNNSLNILEKSRLLRGINNLPNWRNYLSWRAFRTLSFISDDYIRKN